MRLPHQPGKTTHIEKMLAADNVRNHMVARLVKQACDKDRKLVVFSTLIEHLKAIHRACCEGRGHFGPQDGLLPRRDDSRPRKTSASARRSSRSCSRPTR